MIGWYLDLGRWGLFTSEQLEELKEHNLSGVIIEAMFGQVNTKYLDHYTAQMKEAGIPFALRHTLDTTERNPIPQARGFRDFAKDTEATAVVIEVSHWWKSWHEYTAAETHTSNGMVTRLTSDTLNRFVRDYLQVIRKDIGKPIFAMSSNWFIRKYSRPLAGTFRSLTDGYIGQDIRHVEWDEPIDWKEFQYIIQQFVPQKSMIAPAVRANGYNLGVFPVEMYPNADCGVLFDTDLFGKVEDLATSKPKKKEKKDE